MTTSSPLHLVVVTWINIGLAPICAIASIILSCSLFRYREFSFFQKRHAYLSFCVIFASIILFQIILPIMISSIALGKPPTSSKLRGTIVSYVGVFLLGVFSVRVIMLYYDFEFSRALADLKWRRLLSQNDSISSDESDYGGCDPLDHIDDTRQQEEQQHELKGLIHTSCFIANRKTCGSPRILFTICLFVVVSVHAAISQITSRIPFWIGYIIWVIEMLSYIIALGFISLKIRRLDDTWFVRGELSRLAGLTTLFLTICMIIYVTPIFPWIYRLFGAKHWSLTHIDWSYRYNCVVLFGHVFSVCIVYIQTQWVIRHHHSSETRDTRVDLISGERRSSNINLDDAEACSRTLESYEGFRLFMQHLVSEFIVENMLFLIECAWLQATREYRADFGPNKMHQYLHLHFDDMSLHFALFKAATIRKPLMLFKSSLHPFNSEELPTSRVDQHGCRRVFQRYIANNAPFALNISYPVRTQLQREFVCERARSLSVSDLLGGRALGKPEIVRESSDPPGNPNVFSAACSEVWQNTLDSFSRFRRTPAFASVECEISGRTPSTFTPSGFTTPSL